MEASSGRQVGNIKLFTKEFSNDKKLWEEEYNTIMDKKYKKGTRNYSKKITISPIDTSKEAPIYLIPRERGGPSYKETQLAGVKNDQVFYAAISKGFGMQDVSSFTLGPIVGEGLCLVNAAFSKCICVSHIEGGGKVNLKRKNFWMPAKTPLRAISLIDECHISVNGVKWETFEWLRQHEDLWLEEWNNWRQHVALCSKGDFHWVDDYPCVAYKYKERYLTFVEWKKECYIKPSYDILPSVGVYQFLEKIHNDGIAIGLVHPKAITGHAETAITRKMLTELFDSETEMCCQPFVIAAKLLGVKLTNIRS